MALSFRSGIRRWLELFDSNHCSLRKFQMTCTATYSKWPIVFFFQSRGLSFYKFSQIQRAIAKHMACPNWEVSITNDIPFFKPDYFLLTSAKSIPLWAKYSAWEQKRMGHCVQCLYQHPEGLKIQQYGIWNELWHKGTSAHCIIEPHIGKAQLWMGGVTNRQMVKLHTTTAI